jgi:hypothetical protein
MVQGIKGQENARFGANTVTVWEALRILGQEGWELAAVDRGPAGAARLANYILKRPLLGSQGGQR